MKLLKIERTYTANPAKVFAYLTQMENLVKWWGPEGTSISDHNLDLTQKGDWYFVIVDPMGGHHKVSGVVLEVNAPHFVEFTMIVHSQEGPPQIDSVVRFEVAASDAGGTHFILTQSGLTEEQIFTGSTKGWISTLERLDKLLGETR